MKNILILIALFSFAFVSCEKDPGIEESKITYLPKIDVNGNSFDIIDCNTTSYVDPGVDASIGGNPVDAKTTVTGAYFGGTSVSSPDVYTINYSVYNSDSIPGAAFRTVILPPCNGDLVNSIAGLYTATTKRNGVVTAQYTDMKYIIIRETSTPGVYELSDAIGGYYDIGRAYGPKYAASGLTITANDIPANNFTFSGPVGVGLFGGSLVMQSMTVNPAAKTVSFVSDWDQGYKFEVELKQVN